MAYFAINRALSRLEYRLQKFYKGHIPYYILKELLKIRQKNQPNGGGMEERRLNITRVKSF